MIANTAHVRCEEARGKEVNAGKECEVIGREGIIVL